MKLLYKDVIGFSCLILIALTSGLFLNDAQLKINTIHENLENLDDGEQEKLIQRYTLEFTFVIFGMVVFMICVIGMIMTFSRNPMLSNIKNIKNATTKISKGDFNIRIPEIGNKDEIADLCTAINEMAKKLMDQHTVQSNLKLALDESADVAITDKNGIITFVNDKFCVSSKYSKDELIGNSHNLLKSGFHSLEFYKNMWDVISSGKVWHDQIKNKAKDGTLYWNDMVIVPFLDKNKEIQEYIAIRRDISERIKLREKLVKAERMSSIGQLASRMAHDIRNPLSIIRVSLENLKLKYDVDATTEESFDRVERSIDRIAHQIDDVLDFVKGHPAELSQVKFSEIILESLDSLTIPDEIKLILPKDDIKIIADKKLFSIALNNLILNAIQTIDGIGTVEIITEENDEVIIQVKDSGKGIPKKDLDKIFELLFTTKQQGTGLGLASVKSIIESHGGIISVTSPPTVFTITLPKI